MGENNNHTTRAYDLSELVETWSMRVSFPHQASGLFIATKYRRDNYKSELKKGKWGASDAIKARKVSPWKSQTGQWAGMQWYVSQNLGARFEGE
jgi:hypothetical protein